MARADYNGGAHLVDLETTNNVFLPIKEISRSMHSQKGAVGTCNTTAHKR